MFVLVFICVELLICIPLAAYVFGPMIQRGLSVVWEDPTIQQQAAVIQRMKELCVDSNVPEESAKLMVATEKNMTLECINNALEGLDMNIIKAVASGRGGMARLFIGQFGRSLKGFKAGL